MKKNGLKSWLFLLFILFCSYESFQHIISLITLQQPKRIVYFQDRLLLGPSSLVFDRPEGFFFVMLYKLYFSDGDIRNFKFQESEMDIKTYLERIIIRRAFVTDSNINNFRYLFCNSQSVLLKNHQIGKSIIKAEVNFLFEPPLRKELLCKN